MLDGRIYVLGGYDDVHGSQLSSVEVFDPKVRRMYAARGAVYGRQSKPPGQSTGAGLSRRGVVYGRQSASKPAGLSRRGWSKGARLRRMHAIAPVLQHRLLNLKWSLVALVLLQSFLYSRTGPLCSHVINSRANTSRANTHMLSVCVPWSSPQTRRWAAGPSMQSARSYLAAAALEGKVRTCTVQRSSEVE